MLRKDRRWVRALITPNKYSGTEPGKPIEAGGGIFAPRLQGSLLDWMELPSAKHDSQAPTVLSFDGIFPPLGGTGFRKQI